MGWLAPRKVGRHSTTLKRDNAEQGGGEGREGKGGEGRGRGVVVCVTRARVLRGGDRRGGDSRLTCCVKVLACTRLYSSVFL